MADFTVGQEVRLKPNAKDFGSVDNKEFIGQVGRISQDDGNDSYRYHVTFGITGADGSNWEPFSPAQLESAAVEPPSDTRAFKVGDMVKMKHDISGTQLVKGEVYEVKDIDTDDDLEVFNHDKRDWWFVSPHNAILVSPEEVIALNSTSEWGKKELEQLIKEEPKGILMNIVDKARKLVQPPERKRRIKYEVEDMAGNPTTEGFNLMRDILWADPEMQKKIDAKLVEVEKADEAERKANK